MPACGEKVKPPARPDRPGSRADYRAIRKLLGEAAWNGAGIVRAEGPMRATLSSLGEMEGQLDRMAPRSVADRLLENDLRSGILTLRAILQAGIGRQESRGSFLRSDYPNQDDEGWRRNSCLAYDETNRGFAVSYLPVEGI
jgi:succinate dehydrogenase/fumarate reductase flavoprotein subunit